MYPALNDVLSDFLVEKVSTDTTFRSLVGGTYEDSRFYWYYQAEAKLGETDRPGPAFASYAQLNGGRERGGVTSPIYSIRVYAYDAILCFSIETRLNQLLDRISHTYAAADDLNITTKLVHAQDLFDQSNKFAGRELHYEFGVLTATR